MTFPDPSNIDISSFSGIFIYLNSVTQGWFCNSILIALYLIGIIGYSKATGNFEEAMGIIGWFVFIIALLFWVGGLIVGPTLGIVIAIAILGTLVLMAS